jgi:RNA polymerase sigma factor (sigma-70 family)
VVSRPLTPEADLVERARRGDGDAYDQLVRAHQDIAFRTAWLVAGSSADAEDAAQEAFVKGWRAMGRFRAGAPFRPWLLAIVANEARNRRRSAGRREALVLRAAAQRRPSDGAASPPEAAVLRGERRDALLAALERHMAGEYRVDVPHGGHHLWVTLNRSLDERALYGEAARHGVTFTPGGAVTAERRSQTSFRLSFSMVDPEQLDEGIRRLARAIREVRRRAHHALAAPMS